MTGSRPVWLLAVTATVTAVCLSVLAGWQRGGTLSERVVWVAIGAVLVVSAHLLPTLLRGAPVGVRVMGHLLWGACMVAACYGHATFFVLAQQHAGDARALAVTGDVTSIAARAARTLAPVMEERATVTHQLALARVQRCSRDCAGLDVRRVTLAAKLDALNAEAGDIRRSDAMHDRAVTQRDALRADPVTSRLAALLGVSTARVDLFAGLAFAAVLEGVASVLWWIALIPQALGSSVTDRHGPAHDVTAETLVTTLVKSPTTTTVRSTVPPVVKPTVTLPEYGLARLRRDIESGAIKLTVASIRQHLGCSQARASALRRQLADLAA